MRSRLFKAVVVGGFSLAAPLTFSACSADAPREPSPDAAAGTIESADTGTDSATHGDGGQDAGADADGGWAPTK